ncbi:ABC transporter ATP-binding protein [Kitasatospora sp. GAS204B]|uniref:ABC transporter ATP-binding protein n=1 Tax=unclassified Kitasatospora TaxID=2633591 RepID=UPI002475560E|nr:oligopeptide/dipeptide ABC transporter ATP-binding protein [Kitasatospora sp. GAS204B]MDH6117566.1 oligopeptide/dipeptide ABC transporter ATP-binding protein [Kitasatospora sp. GAS204B]
MLTDSVLTVRELQMTFPGGREGLRRRPGVKAVDGLSFDVRAGETLGLVGESGCGKSTTGRMLVRLLDPTGGRVEFQGQDITRLGQRELRPLRSRLQIIFQDPFASLNPRQTVQQIIAAPLRAQGVATAEIRREVRDLVRLVGLAPEHLERYPYQFSGGQAQRIGIARALATRPALVVADEPVSALDVSIQAQIVGLLERLQRELGVAYLFIAHDLAVVKHISHRVAVMYLGRIVEIGDKAQVYGDPAHPYTKALLSAVPLPDPAAERARERIVLLGDPPSPANPPSGCTFHPRCPQAQQICRTEAPLLQIAGPGRREVACHFPQNAAH